MEDLNLFAPRRAEPTKEQVLEVYLKRREKIEALRKEITGMDEKQIAAEKFLLEQEPSIETVAEIYISRRNEASTLEAVVKDIKERQKNFEAWFLAQMAKTGSTKGFKTEVGTIYPTRFESVTVEDWDQFVDATLLRPAARRLLSAIHPEALGIDEVETRAFVSLLRDALPLFFLKHDVNKTAVLEVMGDLDEKTKGRPNPAPSGIKYVAVQKVGVRKS